MRSSGSPWTAVLWIWPALIHSIHGLQVPVSVTMIWGFPEKHIMQAVEGSLRRLKTDYLDLYYAHMPDYATPSR